MVASKHSITNKNGHSLLKWNNAMKYSKILFTCVILVSIFFSFMMISYFEFNRHWSHVIQQPRTGKVHIPRDHGSQNNKYMEVEMIKRKSRIDDVCRKHRKVGTSTFGDKGTLRLTYKSLEEGWSQSVHKKNFLIEWKSRTVFCLNRKVASSRWQDVFNHIHRDNTEIAHMMRSGKSYK